MPAIGRLAVIAVAAIAAAAPASCHGHDAGPAAKSAAERLYAGVGNIRFAEVGDEQAQAFADNGAQLVFAFERRAAELAFRQAARLHPACVPCRLGALWAAGSGFDAGLSDGELARLRAEARLLLPTDQTQLTDVGLFGRALAQRYTSHGAAGERQFAVDMEELARRHATTPLWFDIAAFAWLQTFAQAPDRSDALRRARSLLDAVLANWPDDVGAIHLMLHVLERTGERAKARPLADRLPKLAPNASHLLHMPAHLAIAERRFADAVVASKAALAADERWARALGSRIWDLPMHGHNVLYGLIAATSAGAAKEGLAWADEALGADVAGIETTFWAQEIRSAAYLAEARLADANAIPRRKNPGDGTSYELAMWWLAQGIASARAGDRLGLDRAISRLRGVRGLDALGPQAEASRKIALIFLRAKLAHLNGAATTEHQLKAAAVERRDRWIDTQADPPLWWLRLDQ